MSFICRRGTANCARLRPPYRLPTALSFLPRNSTTLASAAATPALTSPSAPLDIFTPLLTSCPVSPSSVTPGVVLHTGYASLPVTDEVLLDVSESGGVGTSDVRIKVNHLTVTPSYAVTDIAALERLIADAVRLVPVTLESDTAPAPLALSSSFPVSVTSVPPPGSSRVSATIIADHTVRELQVLLAEAERTLAPSTTRKGKIDRFVYGLYLPLLKYGTLVFLTTQLVVYFNWVFVVFDWNLVEPTTYFLAYTGVLCSLVYHYHRCGEEGFTWQSIFQRLAVRKAEKMYAKEQLDVKGMLQLQRRITLIKEELARMSVSEVDHPGKNS